MRRSKLRHIRHSLFHGVSDAFPDASVRALIRVRTHDLASTLERRTQHVERVRLRARIER